MNSHVAKKSLPTGAVCAVLGMTYRTIYNYLRDYPNYFSDTARRKKKGKRFTSEDIARIQTIRHLHSERQTHEAIDKALTNGYTIPLDGGYKPEDINRLIEASWMMVKEAEVIQAETKKELERCTHCEFDLRYHIERGFYNTIFRYEEFSHELEQIKLIVGRLSDNKLARQQRDEEYERLHKWIRFRFLAEEERRVKREEEREGVEVELAKDKLELVHDSKEMVKWIYDKLPHRENEPEK